ncbi:hypothetical protein GCM10023331_03070 [Algivirga pacifica]|uniref:Major facilitator superfamily (MFS) profile domain-containing protein n=2 Tax=Algivirga pacifica TaxID=1162670 RepID=A0ABP9CZ01_9BACT
MLLLIMTGEGIFFLPFVMVRIFRSTILDLFQLSNFQLGTAFSIYGVTAMLSYFFGGLLADRYAPRRLISIALIMTAVGGIVMSYYPSFQVICLVYGFWGITTILLFWAALIRATRQWGDTDAQGKAFGFLDGGEDW